MYVNMKEVVGCEQSLEGVRAEMALDWSLGWGPSDTDEDKDTTGI